jgi:hypothetical protein
MAEIATNIGIDEEVPMRVGTEKGESPRIRGATGEPRISELAWFAPIWIRCGVDCLGLLLSFRYSISSSKSSQFEFYLRFSCIVDRGGKYATSPKPVRYFLKR